MGGCLSKDVAYDTLRSSIVGLLIPNDSDFNEFFKMCRVETQRLTSNILNINQLQSFFVVVSGEISVVLTPKDGKSVIVSTYKPGELIYFFHGNSISCSGGAITNKILRLNLQFRSHDGLAQVIGMDRGSVDRFLDGRGHLRELHRLLELQLTDFMDLPAFTSISRDQLNILGPLMKLRVTEQGDILKYSNGDDEFKLLAPKTVTSPSVSQHVKSMPPVAPRPVGILLCGTCFTLPLHANIHSVLSEFLALTIRSGTGSGSSSDSHHASSVYQTMNMSSNNNRSPNTTGANGGGRTSRNTNHRSRNYELLGLTESDTNNSLLLQKLSLNSGQNLDIMQVFPGSIFGLEESFIKNFEGPHEIVISTGRGLVGYIERETLKYLFMLDKRFKRVLQRNFTAAMLKTVRPHVPLLNDMDNIAFDILAGVVTMKYLPRGERLYKKGQASDFCYIVISGQLRDQVDESIITESVESSVNMINPHHDFPSGSLIGEVALITDSAYFSTVNVHEHAILICISKKSFERIYYGDKSKFAEFNIRVAGKDVELTHILNHPLGNKLFFDFLKMEKAEENILFLNAVAKFDEMCLRFCKDLHATQVELASCEIDHNGAPVIREVTTTSNKSSGNKARSPEAERGGTDNTTTTTADSANNHNNSNHALNSNGGNNLQTIFSVDGLEDVTEHDSQHELDIDDDDRSSYDNATNNGGDHTPLPGNNGDDVSNDAADDIDYFNSIPSDRLLPQRIPSFKGQQSPQQQQQQKSSPLQAAIILPVCKNNSQGNLHESGTNSAPNSYRRGSAGATAPSIRTVLNSTLVAECNEEQEILSPPQRARSHGGSGSDINIIKSPISRSFVSVTGSEEESKKLLEAFGMQAVDKENDNKNNQATNNAKIETVMEATTNEDIDKDNKQISQPSSEDKYPTTTTMITTMSQREMSGINIANRPPLLQVNTFSSNEDQNNNNILTSTSMTNLSIDMDSISRHNASVRQVYLRFENNIAELREVAKNIIEKFVKPDVDQQVNLPEVMMKEVLAEFAKWSNMSDNEVLLRIQETIHNDRIAIQSTPGKKPGTHRKQLLSTPSKSRAVKGSEAEFLCLFQASVLEISKLVKSGPFHRWKCTPAFETFITSIKPYDSYSTAITRHHTNNDDPFSTSNHTGGGVGMPGTPVSGNRAKLLAQQHQSSASNASFNLYVIASRRYPNGLQGGSGSEHSKQSSPAMSNRVYNKPQPVAVSLLNAAIRPAPQPTAASSQQATRKHNIVGISG